MLWQLAICVVGIYIFVEWWKNRAFRNIYNQIPCSLASAPVLGHAVSFMGDGQAGKSTIDAGVKHVLSAWERSQDAIGIFCDLFKAFDYVDHQTLLLKLCHYGVRDCMLKLKLLGREAVNKTGLISGWLVNRFYVVVADPVAADVIMKSYLDKDEMLNIIKPFIGNGTLRAPVSMWRPRRKVLALTFGLKTLNSFVKIFAEQSGVMIEKLKSKHSKDQFSIFGYISQYALDTICESTLGVKVNALNNSKHPFMKAFVEACNICGYRFVRPWLWPDAVFKWMPNYSTLIGSAKIMADFVHKIIKLKRLEMKQKQNNNLENKNNRDENTPTSSFLELLIESSGGEKGYSDLELHEETLVLVLAGSDTTALGASFTSLLLAKFPDVQEKVYKEIQEVLGDSDRPIQAEDLSNLKYLDAVVKESLRMYPPVPLVTRIIDKEITLPSGLTLVPGVGILIHVWALHRNPKYWGPDVDVFRPERFFDSPPTHPAAYIPFSYGPRMCLGYQYATMSIKTALATLIRRYRLLTQIDSDELQSCPLYKEDPIQTSLEVVSRDVNNFQLRVQIRR